MIDALISGKLIKTPELKTGKSGNYYTQFLLSVSVGDEKPVVVSGMAFTETAEKIARMKKGDPLAVVGSLKPSEWLDKATGALKHGLSITANNSLSPYDITKRKPKPANATGAKSGDNSRPFNDPINF
ncbi:MAG: single-stranded DNA-binding protein [Methylococcaceae bacterium]